MDFNIFDISLLAPFVNNECAGHDDDDAILSSYSPENMMDAVMQTASERAHSFSQRESYLDLICISAHLCTH